MRGARMVGDSMVCRGVWREGILAGILVCVLASGVAAGPAPVTPMPAGSGQTVVLALAGSVSGPDGGLSQAILEGAALAIAEADAAGGVGGARIVAQWFDDGADDAAGFDAGAAAANARAMVAADSILAVIGPTRSGAARAMLPVLNAAGLAMLGPAASAPDLTAVDDAAVFRPSGHLTYFRLVAPDTVEGPAMARYWAQTLHLGSVFVLDDGGAYGRLVAQGFMEEAGRDGMRVLGHATVNPAAKGLAGEVAGLLAGIAARKPPALYYGGEDGAGIALVRAAHLALPGVVKGAGEGLYGPEILTAAGFPAAAGWYVTASVPAVPAGAASFVAAYTGRFGMAPDGYALCAYDAASIAIAAMRSVLAAHQPLTRAAVRAAIASGQFQTLQGMIGFDPNGDLRSEHVSLFTLAPGAGPADAVDANFHDLGPIGGG